MRSRMVGWFTAVSVAALVLTAAVPVYATGTNTLVYEPPPVLPGGGTCIEGGNGGGANCLTTTQATALIEFNKEVLGVDQIDYIGKINFLSTGAGGSGDFVNQASDPFVEVAPFADSMFKSVDCNGQVDGGGKCRDGFTVEFDFTGLAQDWQIVKIVIKADGPDFPWGAFVAELPLQTSPLDKSQKAFISSAEYDEYVADASKIYCASHTCKNGTFDPGISHIYLFGTPSASVVAEPGMLLILGLALAGFGIAATKKIGA